jgi:excisionase family DNA binding protein
MTIESSSLPRSRARPALTIKPPVMSLEQAALYLGDRSQSTVRDLIAVGKIQAVKDGKRLLAITASMDAYLATLPVVTDLKPPHPKKFKRTEHSASSE